MGALHLRLELLGGEALVGLALLFERGNALEVGAVVGELVEDGRAHLPHVGRLGGILGASGGGNKQYGDAGAYPTGTMPDGGKPHF